MYSQLVNKDMSGLLEKLPKKFPKIEVDGVCLLSRSQNRQNTAIASVILGKQAGAESMGFMNNTTHKVTIDGVQIPCTCKEILLKPTTAEILLKNEEGNPVFLKNSYGKGTIYFPGFPMERLAYGGTDLFNTMPYYKIYKKLQRI